MSKKEERLKINLPFEKAMKKIVYDNIFKGSYTFNNENPFLLIENKGYKEVVFNNIKIGGKPPKELFVKIKKDYIIEGSQNWAEVPEGIFTFKKFKEIYSDKKHNIQIEGFEKLWILISMDVSHIQSNIDPVPIDKLIGERKITTSDVPEFELFLDYIAY